MSLTPHEREEGIDFEGDRLRNHRFGDVVQDPGVEMVACNAAAHRESGAADGCREGADCCPDCGGEGVIDSGGFTPWGEGINIQCPRCKYHEDNAPAQRESAEADGCAEVES